MLPATPLSPSPASSQPSLAAQRARAVARWGTGLGLLWCVAVAAWAWVDAQGRWVQPQGHVVVWIKLWLHMACAAAVPWLCAALARAWLGQGANRWGALGLALLMAVGGYAGLVERHRLQVREHTVTLATGPQGQPAAPLRIALVADLHLGLYWRGWQLKRLVDTLNAQNVDAVIVAGDWTYDPPLDLVQAFAPLARLRHPVYGVLGNHDTEAPGPALAASLRQALQQHGVRWLGPQAQRLGAWDLVGLGDLWGEQPQRDVAQWQAQPATGRPQLVVAHQPDTAALLPAASASLIVSGHTHGGQIWLPWITEGWVLPGMSQYGWWRGLYRTAAGALFVTPGVGTIGLPARLGVVPGVDVLEIQVQ